MALCQTKSLRSLNISLILVFILINIITPGVISQVFVRHAQRCRSVSNDILSSPHKIEAQLNGPNVIFYKSPLTIEAQRMKQNEINDNYNDEIPRNPRIIEAKQMPQNERIIYDEMAGKYDTLSIAPNDNEMIEMAKTNVICPAMPSQFILFNEMNEMDESQYLYIYPGTVCETAIMKKIFIMNDKFDVKNDRNIQTNVKHMITSETIQSIGADIILYYALSSPQIPPCSVADIIEYIAPTLNVDINVICPALLSQFILHNEMDDKKFEPLFLYIYPGTICETANMKKIFIANDIPQTSHPKLLSVFGTIEMDVLRNTDSNHCFSLRNATK